MRDVVAFETGECSFYCSCGGFDGGNSDDGGKGANGGDGGYCQCSNYLSTCSLLASAPPTKQM